LEILKTDRFDILFMDARMPGLDGLKTTRFIRDEMKIMESEMQVICISAASVNEDWQKYRKAGMNAFLPKPFTEEMLLTTILSVLRDYTLSSEAASVSDEKEKSSGTAGINLNNLYHISAGDDKFVKQMLVSFIESTENGLNALHDAVMSSQWESASDLAHKMLPPCRHIGASELCNLLKKIEESLQDNVDSGFVKRLIIESKREFDAVSELIKEHISKIN
jgi:CheY-like chemotaxis protein/HPt (histidine-containing phosphotransfer) domain-containing protein